MQGLEQALWEKTCAVLAVAVGEVSWEEFERGYQYFYWEFPLHGDEGDETEEDLAQLRRHAALIRLHKRVADEVLSVGAQDGVAFDRRGTDPAAKVRAIVIEERACAQLAELGAHAVR